MARGCINQGLAYQGFVAAGDDDQFFFKQFLDRIITVYTTNRFDFRFGDGLLVGDDSQCLQCRSRQAFQELVPIELCNGLVVFPFGQELPSSATFPQFEREEC